MIFAWKKKKESKVFSHFFPTYMSFLESFY